MPQSLSKCYAHLIFSTKNREPWLTKDLRENMHAYLAKTSTELGSQTLQVGGVSDHVHILAIQSRTLCLSEWVKELKVSSSKWFKEKTDVGNRAGFGWQSGYSVFSVSPGHVDAVVNYIQTQEEHHRKNSFQDELRTLFVKYDVRFDEKYVWD